MHIGTHIHALYLGRTPDDGSTGFCIPGHMANQVVEKLEKLPLGLTTRLLLWTLYLSLNA